MMQSSRFVRGARLAGALALLLAGAGSCKESPSAPEPLALDERLPAGAVRAGQIRRDAERIGGPTAKARIGDFKLYNDRVAVTIADLGHGLGFQSQGGIIVDADWLGERANVSAFGEVAVTYDFAGLEPSSVELISDGRNGEAIVRASGQSRALPLFDAILGDLLGGGDARLEWTTDYILAPDSNRLRIEHEIKNLDTSNVSLSPVVGLFFGTGAIPFLPGRGFAPSNSGASGPYYGAASDTVSYLFGSPGETVSILFGESGLAFGTLGPALDLRARETKRLEHWLVIGSGDLAATESDWRAYEGRSRGILLRGQIGGEAGSADSAVVHVTPVDGVDGYVTRTGADADGRFGLELPPGGYRLVAVSSAGVVGAEQLVELSESSGDVALDLPSSGTLAVRATDAQGRLLPVKLSLAMDGAALPRLPVQFGGRPHAAGLDRTEYIAGTGEVELPAGRYRVLVSRGGEYEVYDSFVQIESGVRQELSVSLNRSVDTAGWMSSEPHVHAQWSPDSRDSNRAKVLGMAGENIELPVSTDHEAVGDFNPAIAELGLGEWIKGIVGTEISTIRYGHFNAFPLTRSLEAPGFGRIDWFGKTPVEIFENVRARPEDPFLQVNHPRFESIGYFRLMKLDRETLVGNEGFSLDFDGLEVINGCDDAAIDAEPTQDWFALLAAGHRVSASGSLDDHAIGLGKMGYPLTYARLEGSTPADVSPGAVRTAYREGHLIVSCGPFVEIAIGESRIGDLRSETGDRVELQVEVRAASWVDVDQVFVLVGGRIESQLSIPPSVASLRLSTTATVTLPAGDRDTWVAVWVEGDQPHGPWAGGRRSLAFTNPIYLDRDGDGVWRP